ncbi:hypothetical protein [uncultured Desulfosarcina sp.]|uniref:hypothetical protein n=1 Tax=uncultured Desulfosarcina sp. TaxID=218289 RepID=UPI0029C7132C|nr:hypothetical protein [uncultured Desulfosarcina sp.]
MWISEDLHGALDSGPGQPAAGQNRHRDYSLIAAGSRGLLKKLDRPVSALYFFLTFLIEKDWTRCSVLSPGDFFTFIIFLARVCPARADCSETPNRQTKPWADQKTHGFFSFKGRGENLPGPFFIGRKFLNERNRR